MGIPWRAGGLAALLAVAGCASLSLHTTSPLRPLDYLRDDIASLLLVLDLPASLEPLEHGAILDLDFVIPASGERHVRAVLLAADASDLAGALPPPAEARSYYFLGFSAADKAAVQEALVWARALPQDNNAMALSLSPGLCRTGEVDTARARISVLVALPGETGLAPLVADLTVDDMLAAASMGSLPTCNGHSG